MEAGSVEHIYKLESQWPTKVKHIKRAFSVLFAHLDVLDISSLAGNSNPEALKRIMVFKASLNATDRGLTKLVDEKEANRAEIFEVIEPHISTLLIAVEFVVTHASVIMSEYESGALDFAKLGGIAIVDKLLLTCRPFLEKEDGHTNLRTLVQYALKSWFRAIPSTPPDETSVRSAEGYARGPRMFFTALWNCLVHESSKDILLECVGAFTTRTHRLFAESFVYRCTEWATIHQDEVRLAPNRLNCDHLVDHVRMAQELGVVPGFYRALVKCQFASLALRLGFQYRRAFSTRPCGGSVVFEVAMYLFPPERERAYELVHVIPQLLENGLLTVMLLVGKGAETALSCWGGSNPFELLFKMSHHPLVCRALHSAIASFSPSELEQIKAKDSHRCWSLFTNEAGILTYQTALKAHPERKPLSLCDCFEVSRAVRLLHSPRVLT